MAARKGADVTGLEGVVLGLPPALVYATATAMSMAESAAFAGLLLPGETVLFLCGVLAGLHVISLLPLGVLALAGASTGDSLGYALGRWWGPALRGSRLGRRVGDPRWERALGAVRRRGGSTVVLGRWVGVLRALVPMAAGMSGMPWRRFLVANALGAAVWVGVVLPLGYLSAASWGAVLQLLAWVGPVVLLVVATVGQVRRSTRRWRGRSSRVPAGRPGDRPAERPVAERVTA